MFSLEKTPEMHIPNSIIIFKQNCNTNLLNLPKETLYIVESKNEDALRFLKDNKLTAICCGMSNKDTVNISSLDIDNAVICLQRQLKTFEDKIAHQGDYPIVITGEYDMFTILSAFSVLLLCDENINKEVIL